MARLYAFQAYNVQNVVLALWQGSQSIHLCLDYLVDVALLAGEAKSLKKPPPGVDDITAVIIILLEGNPKDKSWGAACKVSDESRPICAPQGQQSCSNGIQGTVHCNPSAVAPPTLLQL